ncbi:hypothetical protein M758_UG187800 [Ceratodon purpureus]|nr:hypothetical protein M758_UG187800 [Ceratodon purpureus]
MEDVWPILCCNHCCNRRHIYMSRRPMRNQCCIRKLESSRWVGLRHSCEICRGVCAWQQVQ